MSMSHQEEQCREVNQTDWTAKLATELPQHDFFKHQTGLRKEQAKADLDISQKHKESSIRFCNTEVNCFRREILIVLSDRISHKVHRHVNSCQNQFLLTIGLNRDKTVETFTCFHIWEVKCPVWKHYPTKIPLHSSENIRCPCSLKSHPVCLNENHFHFKLLRLHA